MGRLMDKLMVECRSCGYGHVPHRLSARYHGGGLNLIKKRIQLWQCKQCGHFWEDSLFKKKS